MAPIHHDRPDYLSISYNDDLTHFKQNINSLEKIVCKICQTYFTNWISLEQHLKNCYGRICAVGGQNISSYKTFYEHALTHEATSVCKKVILKQRKKLESHKCRFCKMSYKYPAELRKHLMTHKTVKHYLCSHCGNYFSLSCRSKCESTHSQHSHAHINTKSRIKLIDSKELVFNSYLREDERNHDEEKPYHCSDCSKSFRTQRALTVHIRAHTGEKPYQCSHCNKRFALKIYLSSHERIHTGEKPYQCSHCSKCFNQQGTLTRHERIHTGEYLHECSYCNKRFVQQSALTFHERIHTGDKPYECSLCKKTFSEKGTLTRHERLHSGEKPFECSHCGKRFALKIYLSSHERIHTGAKPYVCSVCGKGFSQQGTLNRHERTHTGENPYECSHCSKRFARQDNLTLHERIHTGT